MKELSKSDTKVSKRSMMKVVSYPPVNSKTLFDKVATREPTITVNVMSAILFEKCFIPKNEDVNAAVIVGQEP